jgi:signal transduction histidine kinase
VRGLGLAIAKRLCDLHGWTLEVRSPLDTGRGTAFTIGLRDEAPAPG